MGIVETCWKLLGFPARLGVRELLVAVIALVFVGAAIWNLPPLEANLYADAARWWGALAGFLGLDDFRRRLRRVIADEPCAAIEWPAFDVAAKVLVCIFLIGPGSIIPLTNGRIDGLSARTPEFEVFMALFWPLLSLAGWCYVISRAPRLKVMTAVCAGGFFVMLGGAWATGVS